jgi:hypothetical protein
LLKKRINGGGGIRLFMEALNFRRLVSYYKDYLCSRIDCDYDNRNDVEVAFIGSALPAG